MPELLCMASGIARPAGRKKSPRHEYRGLVDQFPPVRIVDGEPRCVSSRDEAGCVIGRDITATIVLPRLPASNRDKIFPIFFSASGRRLLRRRTMPLVNFLPKSSSSETGRMWQRLIFTEKRRWPICSTKEELIRSRLMFSFRAFGRRKKEKKNLAFSRREANIITSSSLEFASLLFPSISSSPPARVFEVNRSPKISASTGKSPAASAG